MDAVKRSGRGKVSHQCGCAVRNAMSDRWLFGSQKAKRPEVTETAVELCGQRAEKTVSEFEGVAGGAETSQNVIRI